MPPLALPRISTDILLARPTNSPSSEHEPKKPVTAINGNKSVAPIIQMEQSNIPNATETSNEIKAIDQVINTMPTISPHVLQEIIERVRETLPQQPSTSGQSTVHDVSETPPPLTRDAKAEEMTIDETQNCIHDAISTPPLRPPSPVDYTPSADIPQTFSSLEAIGIAADESSAPLPQKQNMHKNR